MRQYIVFVEPTLARPGSKSIEEQAFFKNGLTT